MFKHFHKFMISGKVNAVLKLLTEKESKTILPLTDKKLTLLNQKHRLAKERFDDYLLERPELSLNSSVIFI